jgi:phenylalanyl-tRNA synthetase alpha subunit
MIEAAERAAIADEKAAVGPIPMREPDYVVDDKETDEAFIKRVKSAALKRKRAMSTVEKKADKLRLHAEMKKRGANSDEDLNKIYAAENAARAAEKATMLARAKKAEDDKSWATFKDAIINVSTPYNKMDINP